MKTQELSTLLKNKAKSKSGEKTINRLLTMAKEAAIESDQEAVVLLETKMEHMLHSLIKHRERETQWYRQQLAQPLTHRMISGAMKDTMNAFGISSIDQEHIPNVAKRVLGALRTTQTKRVAQYQTDKIGS